MSYLCQGVAWLLFFIGFGGCVVMTEHNKPLIGCNGAFYNSCYDSTTTNKGERK